MLARDFCYWLQGYLELSTVLPQGRPDVPPDAVLAKPMTAEQVATVRAHLNLVFQHDIDPATEKVTGVPGHEAQKVHDGAANVPAHLKPGTAGGPAGSGVLLRC